MSMQHYIISIVIIILAISIAYIINSLFNYKFKPSKDRNEGIKFNLLSDYIIILIKEDCPYCLELESLISKSTKKHTIIKLTKGKTFEFDNTFTNLDSEERNNIIRQIQSIFTPGQTILFPVILTKNDVYNGLPKKEITSKIFNL